MSRILLVWQLGGNLGHITRLRVLGRGLRARGHHVTFAFEDMRGAAALTAEGFSVVQAPVLRPSDPDLPRQPVSYPEMLFHCGFADAPALTAAVRAWRALYRMLAPDLIVFDHAPVALLAARSIGIPRVVVGTGFTSPPRVSPMPTIRPWEDVPAQRLEESEQRALDTANAVMSAVGGERLKLFHDLFDVEENILGTLAELDHYDARPNAQYLGPILDSEPGKDLQWPAGSGKRIFVYLRPSSPAFQPVAAFLKEADYRSIWFAPGLTRKRAENLASQSLSFSEHPLNIIGVAATADLAISAAGHGTASALFLGGVPMLLAPGNVEQLLLARRIASFGNGDLLQLTAFKEHLSHTIGRIDRKRAKTCAASYGYLRAALTFEKVTTRVERQLSAGQSVYARPCECA